MQRSDFAQVAKAHEQIAELAHRVRRLCPDHRNPHRFHEEKSEIAFALSQLAEGDET